MDLRNTVCVQYSALMSMTPFFLVDRHHRSRMQYNPVQDGNVVAYSKKRITIVVLLKVKQIIVNKKGCTAAG